LGQTSNSKCHSSSGDVTIDDNLSQTVLSLHLFFYYVVVFTEKNKKKKRRPQLMV